MGLIKGKCCPNGHLMDTSWKHCPVCIAPIRGWWVYNKPGQPDEVQKVYTVHQGKSKIGSGADCEIRVLHESIGRHHAMLVVDKSNFTISDLHSGKPLVVNNIEINTYKLIDGDVIKLGDQEFKVKIL